MKRRNRPTIPDFSHKRTPAPEHGVPQTESPPHITPPQPGKLGKPHHTSAKSGRRGQ